MKKHLLIFLFTSLLFGCVPEDHVLQIEIVNNTTEPVKDVRVFTAGEKVSFEVDVLPAGQRIDHTMQVQGNLADGEYNYRFSRNNGEQESGSGNYLEEEKEEGPLKKTLVFEIQEQGVNVNQRVLEVE